MPPGGGSRSTSEGLFRPQVHRKHPYRIAECFQCWRADPQGALTSSKGPQASALLISSIDSRFAHRCADILSCRPLQVRPRRPLRLLSRRCPSRRTSTSSTRSSAPPLLRVRSSPRLDVPHQHFAGFNKQLYTGSSPQDLEFIAAENHKLDDLWNATRFVLPSSSMCSSLAPM